MRVFLFIFIFALNFSSFAQVKLDSSQLRLIWNNNIIPIIEKDTSLLSKGIEFPISGLWSMYMGFNMNPDIKHDKNFFFKNIDKFISSSLIAQLENKSFLDFQLSNSLGFTEVSISCEIHSQEQDGLENALVFFFRKINGDWKLWSCSIVG